MVIIGGLGSLLGSFLGAAFIVLLPLLLNQLPAWLAKAAEHERNWLTSIGFTADPGKHALVPGESGKLARVLVGRGDGADGEQDDGDALAGSGEGVGDGEGFGFGGFVVEPGGDEED